MGTCQCALEEVTEVPLNYDMFFCINAVRSSLSVLYYFLQISTSSIRCTAESINNGRVAGFF